MPIPEVAPEPTRDLRVVSLRPLVSPALLTDDLPLDASGAHVVSRAREDIVRILNWQDDRLFVVVGPCSVHDCGAALEYAQRLAALAQRLSDDVRMVMRVYFEKPRTTLGWKGLINDPHLDGSYAVNQGLRLARQLLLDIISMGLPAGCEFLDPITPQFFADLVTWGAIGARTTESQVHRQLASGLSMPVGFKNGTSGDVQIALDAVRAAAHPHSFFGVTDQGLAGIVTTRGNLDCHVILRGGHDGPNYDARCVSRVLDLLRDSELPSRLVVDASHGNSSRDFHRQPVVVHDLAEQIANGQRGIAGAMIESFLVEGRQDLADDPALLTYGQSITDACIGWDDTESALEELASAVRARRAHR
ncbi:MAG TPA: 3-deoxy-7-phosphoheptulonate synthase [Chloroflexota bacterium]|jgi:3-deoxy-7-phosphoheptulonate synthase